MSLLYKEIAENIKELINSDSKIIKLPTERELSIKYNVSRQTIRNALLLCEKEGLLSRRQGSGIYLSPKYLSKINKVALIIPNGEDYIFPVLVSKLENLLSKNSYSLEVYYTNDQISDEKKIIENLIKNPVSSLIVYQSRNALPSPLSDKYQLIKQQGANIMFIGEPPVNFINYNYISFDDFSSGYNCGKYISEKDQNWCAVFIHDNLCSINRYFGLVQYLEDNNIAYDENNINWINYNQLKSDKLGNVKYLSNIIQNVSSLPSIYILGHEQIAYDTLIYLNNTKSITEDMTFISFECHYLNNMTNTQIISYDIDIDLLCSKITSMSINCNKKEKEVYTLPLSSNA